MKCNARSSSVGLVSLGLVAVAALLALAACGGDDKQPPKAPDTQMTDTSATAAATATTPPPADTAPATTASATTPPPADPPKPAEQPLTDEQIMAITAAANDGEVQAAKLAQTNAKNAKVKAFAAHMVTEHGAALKKGQAMATKKKLTAADSPASTQLKSDAQAAMDALKTKKGADFDAAYMDAQVKMHQQVLDLIDNKLLPAAKDADLKADLTAIRPKIAEHLKSAQDIQGSLGATAAAGQKTSTK